MNNITETIQQQKNEKQRFNEKRYIKRERLKEIDQKSIDSTLIKVITGPRRAGKSVFAFLLLEGEEFGYVNFDSRTLSGSVDHNELFKAILEVYPKTKKLFLDEVQNLDQWELFVQTLQRNDYNIIITGSNSKLLSKELSSRLTGRYLPIEILPFSFTEYLSAKGLFGTEIEKNTATKLLNPNDGWNPYDERLLNLFNEYFYKGGYPEIISTDIDDKSYLTTLFDSILLKDIVNRYAIRVPVDLSNLAKYLISNVTKEYSYRKLSDSLGFSGPTPVKTYLDYLQETYLLNSLQRYFLKTREQINAPRKIYCIDNGFVDVYPVTNLDPKGRLLENLVFIELNRTGYEPNSTLFYYKTRNEKEVDFLLKYKNTGYEVEKLIQVAYSVENEETAKREIDALLEASEELKCDNLIVITWDYEQNRVEKGKNIKFIPIWKFLLFG